jgi:hypothetical protein
MNKGELFDAADRAWNQHFLEETRLEARDKVQLLVATLEGVREMAYTEARDGSAAWACAVAEIDKTLREVRE